ncbi:MAG: flagellar biosynthesis protein [Pseudomonadota bacterium]|nr:flagellar biosynthesis protein [Pseudomonadota bacterium]
MSTLSLHDQAAGLRQMFAGACARFVPLVSNPHVSCGGVLLERLSTAFAERGARVLVVDAGERAGSAGEMAMIELAQCVERLTPQVAYLAARGLAIRFVDTGGSTRAFLERAAEAAPGCDVVMIHAPANELCRMFAHGRHGDAAISGADMPCPIVIADDRPPSVTHAYASMKLLAQRAGLVVSELLLGAAPHSPRADRIAAKLAACADNFFAGVLRDWARVDPAGDPCDAPSEALRRIVAARFENHAAVGTTARPAASRADAWAAP